MAKDWEELAGEAGEHVPASRLERMLRMGGLGLGVSATAIAGKVKRSLLPQTREQKRAHKSAQRLRQAERIVEVLGRLKGASMKIGQMLSTDPDLLPPEYLDVLAKLQQSAPPMTWATVKAQVEGALDRPMEAVYARFDPEPIGSASIGQVHRARLHDGTPVAVKIQYPGVEASLQSDLDNIAGLMHLGRAVADRRRLDDYLAEIRTVLTEEADYVAEAANLRRYSEVLGAREGIRVPRPFEEWTRRTVLTMELLEGRKLDEAVATMPDGAVKDELLRRFVATYSWMFHVLMELHSDPHPGNFLIDVPDDLDPEHGEVPEIGWLDFGCVRPGRAFFADGMLDILDACWQQDHERAAALYRKLGFGRDDEAATIFRPEALWAYHQIILEPFLARGPFDFGRWRPRQRIQRFVLDNPWFLKLVPPAESLMYLRVVGGIKGMLGRVEGRVDVCSMAVDLARERGRLTSEPRPWVAPWGAPGAA